MLIKKFFKKKFENNTILTDYYFLTIINLFENTFYCETYLKQNQFP